jgi:hypothetical protein
LNYSPDEASAVMVDVVFSLEATLGDDHASALSLAVRRPALVRRRTEAGILPLSGWRAAMACAFVGRRSRLVLRLPIRRSASADSLAAPGSIVDGTPTATRRRQCTSAVSRPRRRLFALRQRRHRRRNRVPCRCRALLAERGLKPQLITGKARRTAVAPKVRCAASA